MKVIYDHREERCSIPGLLDLSGVEIEPAQLAVGDYILSDRVAIERKSASDLVQSIISGRLFEQIERLKEAYPVAILVSEGNPRGLPRESWLGALGSVIRKEVVVLSVEDEAETAEWIARLARQEAKGPSRPRGSGRKAKDPDRQLEQMLAQIPGISITAASKLLQRFGNLQGLARASEDDLRAIDGIGKKRAEEIASIFSRQYKDSPF